MDNIDLKILKALKKNARISLSDIGNIVSLSPSSVSERVRKLENSGIINQYTTILNGESFGKELLAYMFISLENPKYTDEFSNFLNSEDDVLECHLLAGNYDYIIKIATYTPATLAEIINKIKGLTGIQKTYTNVVLGQVKNEYSVSPSSKEID